MGEHTFRYVECSIPDGMTVQDHQRLRREERRTARRWAPRPRRLPSLRKRPAR